MALDHPVPGVELARYPENVGDVLLRLALWNAPPGGGWRPSARWELNLTDTRAPLDGSAPLIPDSSTILIRRQWIKKQLTTWPSIKTPDVTAAGTGTLNELPAYYDSFGTGNFSPVKTTLKNRCRIDLELTAINTVVLSQLKDLASLQISANAYALYMIPHCNYWFGTYVDPLAATGGVACRPSRWTTYGRYVGGLIPNGDTYEDTKMWGMWCLPDLGELAEQPIENLVGVDLKISFLSRDPMFPRNLDRPSHDGTP